MGTDIVALAKEGVDAFNKSDWGRFKQLLSPNSVYQEFATGRRFDGPDAIVEVNKAWKSAFPDAKGTVNSALASSDTAVLEITWTGTQTGPLQTPTGDMIPATGKQVKIPAVQLVTVAGSKITENRHYFDMFTLMEQLGVIPATTRA